MERGTFQDSAAKLFNVLPANIRNCSDFKVYCREVNAYLLKNICKQFVNCIQGCITITNLYYIFIFYTISFYSPIAFYIVDFNFFFVVYYSFSFFILQFVTGQEPLGVYTVNKPFLNIIMIMIMIMIIIIVIVIIIIIVCKSVTFYQFELFIF